MMGGVLLLALAGCSDGDPATDIDAAVMDRGPVGGDAKPDRALVDQSTVVSDTLAPTPDTAPDRGTVSTRECVIDLSCKVDADCVAKGYKVCLSGSCGQCKADTDCMTTVFRGGCNPKTHMCSLCKTDAHCAIGALKVGTGKCGPMGMCMHCGGDTDCQPAPANMTRYCASMPGNFGLTFKTCQGCKTDADCKTSPLKGCDPKLGACNHCRSDAECCMAGRPCVLTCNKTTGKCACTSNQQCATALGLKAYVCR